MSPLPSYDAAIVGLGPVGATLAALLAGRGLRVVALDRETAPHTIPRAAHLDGAALAVLAQAGVAPEGRPIDGFDLVDRRGRLLLRGRPAEAPPAGVPAALLIHQPSVERALRQRLAALGVEARLGHTVGRVAEARDPASAEAVRIEGVGPDGPFAIRTAVVVGCDGANSVVREQIDAALVGGRFAQRWLVVDVLAPPGLALPDRLLQIADPARPTTSVPFAAPRHRWEFRLRPDEPDGASLAAVPQFLAPYVDPAAVEVERAAVYTFRDVVADRWRSGRVVLAGDAAHQMPPFLGQGLGAGLRDVAVLAPLVESVVRGAAPDALDAYEAERRPHVAATVRQAVRLGRLVTLPEPLASARDGLLRVAGRVPALQRRLLDVRG